MVFTRNWWKAAAVRAIKTMCQTAIAIIPAAVTITAVDWLTVAGTAALAGVMSILTSLAGLPEVREEQTSDEDGSPVVDRREAMLRNIREMPIDELQDMIRKALDESGIAYQIGGDGNADR